MRGHRSDDVPGVSDAVSAFVGGPTVGLRGAAGPDVDVFLRDAELAGERLSAIVRLVIFLTLLALLFTSRVDHHHEQFALFTVAAYGVVSVVALVLAWRRIFHPARWKTYEFSRLYP